MSRDDKGRFESEYVLSEYADIHDSYAEWVNVSIDKEPTQNRLKDDVRTYLHWAEEENVHPYEATENDVRRYIKSLTIAGDADTTITRRTASVSKYYHTLLTDPDLEGVLQIDVNPCAHISLPKDFEISAQSEYVTVIRREGREDTLAPSYESLKPIFNHVPGKRPATRTRNKLICHLAWQTAMRSDELSRVRLDNIDLNKREIKIRSSKLKPKQELYIRRVWWEPDLNPLMHRWINLHREQLNPKANDEFLFVGAANGHEKDNKSDYQLAPGTISRVVKRAAHNAGIQEPLVKDAKGGVKQWLYTAHRLRHSRITYLCNEVDDLSIHFVRMMAGHENLDTTLDYVEADWETARTKYQTRLAESSA